jgi:hypothetical protein
MTKILYDAVLREKLPNLERFMELCDEEGHVLARIVPVVDPALYSDLEPQISKEELRRRLAEPGKTYTTAEVLAYLESL